MNLNTTFQSVNFVLSPVENTTIVFCIFRPAILDNFVSTIDLPNYGCIIPEKTTCSVYGWGYTGCKLFFHKKSQYRIYFIKNCICFLFFSPYPVIMNCIFFCTTLVINSDGLLRVAHLFIMGNEKCSQYHQGKVTLNESEICAGAENIATGPCEVKREIFK